MSNNEEKPRSFFSERDDKGNVYWYVQEEGRDKVIHRETGGPAYIGADGAQEWWFNGRIHRDEKVGPARILPDGTKMYYNNNILHRTSGPAVIYPNGGYEYWTRGKQGTVWTKDKKELRSENPVMGVFAKFGNHLMRKANEVLK